MVGVRFATPVENCSRNFLGAATIFTMPLIPTHHFFAAAMFLAEKPTFLGGLSGFDGNAWGCADVVGAVGWAEGKGC